jgi:hypothetical protein
MIEQINRVREKLRNNNPLRIKIATGVMGTILIATMIFGAVIPLVILGAFGLAAATFVIWAILTVLCD